MIYRFKSKLDVQDKLQAFPVSIPGSGLDQYGPWVTNYEEKFEETSKRNKALKLFSKKSESFKTFKAPLFEEGKYGLAVYFDRVLLEEELPEIWGLSDYLIVSGKVKQVIETCDDDEHQFLPIQLLNKNWEQLSTDTEYYWLNLRRFLSVDVDKNVVNGGAGFLPVAVEEDFIHTLKNNESLQEHIGQIPIWRHYCLAGAEGRHSQARVILYFNENFYQKLLDSNVRGIKQYSVDFGLEDESVVKLV